MNLTQQAAARPQPDRSPYGELADSLICEHVISEAWLTACGVAPGAAMMLIKVVGDCMEPTIGDAALIAIDCNARPRQGVEDIFVFRHGAGIYVKRLLVSGALLRISMDSQPGYCAMERASLIGLDIIIGGRVFWTGEEHELGHTVPDLSRPQGRQ